MNIKTNQQHNEDQQRKVEKIQIYHDPQQSKIENLDILAKQAEALESGQGNGQPMQDQLDGKAAIEAAQANQAMNAAISTMSMGFLRAVRARMAKNLPEIKNEWTEESLKAVADTIPPVLNKYMAKWLPMMEEHAEEAALVMACVPLLFGYMAASEKNEKTNHTKEDASQPKQASDGGQPAIQEPAAAID